LQSFDNIAEDTVELIKDLSDGEILEALQDVRNIALDVVGVIIPYESLIYTGYRNHFRNIRDGAGEGFPLDPYLVKSLTQYYIPSGVLTQVMVYHRPSLPNDTDAIVDCNKIYVDNADTAKAWQDAVDEEEGTLNLDLNQVSLLTHELTHVEQCAKWGGRKEYAVTWFQQLSKEIVLELIRNRNLDQDTLHDSMDIEKEAANRSDALNDLGIYNILSDSINISLFLALAPTAKLDKDIYYFKAFDFNWGGSLIETMMNLINAYEDSVGWFDGSQSYDSGGGDLGYIWTFGDGNAFTTPDNVVAKVYSYKGEYDARLTVVNDQGYLDSTSAKVVVYSDEAEITPVLDSIGNQTVTVGDTLSFNISAQDPYGDPLTYSTDPLPSGASLDSETFAVFDPITQQFTGETYSVNSLFNHVSAD